MERIRRMNWVTQSLQVSIVWGCLMLVAGCSSTHQATAGIPEIQGVWRHSEDGFRSLQSSLTFEFYRNQFRVNGYPDVYARGQYSFETQPQGAYQLSLRLEENRGFDLSKLQIKTTGERILFIDRKRYRRILRH